MDYPKFSLIAYCLLISYNEAKQEVLHQVLKAILIKRTPEKTLPYPDSSIFPIIEKDLDQESLKLAIRIAAEFFDYNPRRLKQYINALRLRIYITYYSIGITLDETEKEIITIEQISKFTALTLQYPRLLLALKRNQYLLAELEKYASDKFIQSNNSIILSLKSTPNSQDEGNANYWISNYPKISKLLCPQTNNEGENQDNCIFQNASIKRLLEVSPQGIPPKYFKLREFLATKKWEEADMETYQVMLQVAGREEERWLRVKDIEQFPCKDLRIIDQLWVKHSDGKFGFSVQKKIYQSNCGTKDYNNRDQKIWENYSDLYASPVVQIDHLYPYSYIIYSSSFKPRWLILRDRGLIGLEGVLFSRAETCGL